MVLAVLLGRRGCAAVVVTRAHTLVVTRHEAGAALGAARRLVHLLPTETQQTTTITSGYVTRHANTSYVKQERRVSSEYVDSL